MQNKILLVSFQSNTDTIGLKYIHSYLSKNHIDSHILFVPNYYNKDFIIIKKFLKSFKPKIIGISLMSQEFYDAKQFSIYVKKEFPEITIVWGGIHPTVDPESCLDYADYVFIGESEKSFLDFVSNLFKNKPVDNIPNLASKSHKNPLRQLSENLDEFPFPEHFPKESFILDNNKISRLNESLFKKYTRYNGKFYSLITTRGCPFSCAYCCNSFFSKLYGRTMVRKRSIENVIEELKIAVKNFPDIIYINIQDDNFFSYDIQWMKEFGKRFKKEIKKRFVCRTTPAHLTEEKISILKDAGLSWIFMGLQSGSPRINKEIYNRFVPNEKFIESTNLVQKYGVAGYYDVILDNPYEKEQDTVNTLNVLLKIKKPFMVQLFSLCFYHGTEICNRALKDNLKIENPLKKNYLRYKLTFLNKLIRICPLYPKNFITYVVKNRKSVFAKILMNMIYYPSIFFLEPLLWLRLILISFDYDIFKTTKMIFTFIKTGVNKMIFRK